MLRRQMLRPQSRDKGDVARTTSANRPPEAVGGPDGPASQASPYNWSLAMSIALTVSTVLKDHVTLETEGIDRIYLNAYVPQLQHEGGVVGFFRRHRGALVVSSALMAPISAAFVRAVEEFVAAHHLPLITFRKGERKDDIAARYRARFPGPDGVLFVGKAQERLTTYRTQKRRNPETGKPYPWIYRTTAMVNHYYFYLMDDDFGPLFIKFCRLLPLCQAKVCLNGHEYVKRQLTQSAGSRSRRWITGYSPVPTRRALQAICDVARPPEDRAHGSPVAASVAASLHRTRSGSRLSVRPVGLAGGMLPDPGPGSSANGAALFRDGHP